MQPQYRAAYAQQQMPQRSPAQHQGQQRRGGIGPMMAAQGPGAHPQVPLTQAQLQQQQVAAQQASELAKRRSRKPTDKNLVDGVEDCVVDSEVVQRYKELRDVERRLDATMTRKRLDVAENINRPSKTYKTLRIWVSNTVEDQIWQGNGLNVDSFDFTPNMEASWRVKIEGHLLDDENDEDNKEEQKEEAKESKQEDGDKMDEDKPQKAKSAKPKPKFSHFFKSMKVEFDASRLRNGNETTVEWQKPEPPRGQPNAAPAAAADFDEITFKRNGDENCNITINLYRHEIPERYKLSSDLAEVVDMQEATQHEAVMGLWEYIRISGLQEDEEKRNFRCDELLRRVVRRGEIGHIPLLSEYVTQHLSPLPPVSIPYTIRVDEDFHKDPQPTVYDIQVAVADPLRTTLQPILHNPEYATMLKEVTQLDDQLARIVQGVSVSKAKHTFFKSMAEDPANFVRSWLSSQKRDMDVIMGESTRGGSEAIAGDEWRKGGKDSVWTTQNARESVNVLLSKQPR